MAVLVAGGAGFVGGQVVLALRDRGEAVVVLDDLSTGSVDAVPAGVRLVVGDLGDAVLLPRLFATEAIDTVIHAAGPPMSSEGLADPLGFHLAAASRSRDLVAATAAAGIGGLIFVAGGCEEGGAAVAATPSAAADRAIEAMLRQAERHAGLRSVTLRTATVAGADPIGRAGPSAAASGGLIGAVVDGALGLRDHVSIRGADFAMPDRTATIDHVHVADVAAAVTAAVRHLRRAGPSLVLDCGSGRAISALEIIEAVQDAVRRPHDVRARRAGDSLCRTALPEALRETIDWTPRLSDLRTMVRHAVSWRRRMDVGRPPARSERSPAVAWRSLRLPDRRSGDVVP